jgi:mono/diheme cytochrome c family protein
MSLLSRAVGCPAVVGLLVSVAFALSAAHAETPLERGAYLMRGIVGCGNCHTPKDQDGKALADQELAGGYEFKEKVFDAVAANITPDSETGIGKWTDQQIIDAIRNGKRPNGTIIGPPMPIEFYRNISDTDARAIVAYLRSVKPISHKLAKSTYNIPLPPSYGPPVTHVPDVPRANKVAYGHYLANIAHCLECHTQRGPTGLDTAKLGAGGREIPAFTGGVIMSANLTPANPEGIAHWTNAQVEKAITDGVRPDGRQLVRVMAFDWYRNTRKDDLDALVAYLRTLKPAMP